MLDFAQKYERLPSAGAQIDKPLLYLRNCFVWIVRVKQDTALEALERRQTPSMNQEGTRCVLVSFTLCFTPS